MPLHLHPTSHRIAVHGSLLSQGSRAIQTTAGSFTFHRFRQLETGVPAFALSRGPLRGEAPLLSRVHSSCVTSEILGACDCDCAAQLEAALRQIDEEGRGILFYLCQEGRGSGYVAKARDRMLVQASRESMTTFDAYEKLGLPHDSRDYRDVASIRTILAIEAPLRLLSNNPVKAARLDEVGVDVVSLESVATSPSGYEGHYLEAKRRSGHALPHASGSDPISAPPRPVVACTPTPHRDELPFFHVAAYWLPVAGNDAASIQWLEAQVWVDVERGGERLILVGPDGPGHGGGWLPQEWSDRFPLRQRGTNRRDYDGWLARVAREGRGTIGLLRPGEQQVPPELARLGERPVPGS